MLVDEWGGGHLVKGDEKEEEVPSSLGEARAFNSQERAVRENHLDENQMLETEDEMRGAEQQKDNHEKLRKRGVEDGMKKRMHGIPKPVADEIGAKKKKKKRKGKDAKKTKKQKKTRPKKKSKSQTCDNKCTGKEVQEKKISSSGRNSRDTECCNDKWAAYTSSVIGLAPNVIKQVGKFFFFKS